MQMVTMVNRYERWYTDTFLIQGFHSLNVIYIPYVILDIPYITVSLEQSIIIKCCEICMQIFTMLKDI